MWIVVVKNCINYIDSLLGLYRVALPGMFHFFRNLEESDYLSSFIFQHYHLEQLKG